MKEKAENEFQRNLERIICSKNTHLELIELILMGLLEWRRRCYGNRIANGPRYLRIIRNIRLHVLVIVFCFVYIYIKFKVRRN